MQRTEYAVRERGDGLLSRVLSDGVPSALQGFTFVFGTEASLLARPARRAYIRPTDAAQVEMLSARRNHVLCIACLPAAIIIAASFSSPVVAQSAMRGEWVGSLRNAADTQSVWLDFATGVTNEFSASVLASQPHRFAVTAARASNLDLALTLVGGRDTFELRGARTGDMVSGTLTTSQSTGTFMLIRTAPVNPSVYDEYAGGYELGRGRLVFIRRGDRLGWKAPFGVERSWLQFVETSGRTRLLFATSQSEFFAGPAFGVPAPVMLRVRFVRDGRGRVVGMHWKELGSPEVYAPRTTRYRFEEVRFMSGDVTLAGRLIVPTGSGRHPGVVLLPGGPGPSNRNENYFAVADVLAAAGMATLTFEKRGTGASLGDWRLASYRDLAGDALSAVRFLRSRSDLDGGCIGLWGISEGGWIAPLAAHSSSEVAFVAVVGASGISHSALDLALLERTLRAEGIADTTVARAVATERGLAQYARTRRNWRDALAAVEFTRGAPWFGHSIIATHTGYDLPVTQDHWFWTLYGTDADYDPLPTLRELHVPVLAIWGAFDPAAPPDLNVPRFESARAGRSDSAFRLVVLPRGDHVLWEFPTANTSGFYLVNRFVPEYFDLLGSWFSKRTAGCTGRASDRRPRQ